MRDEARFEDLLAALDDLAEANLAAPILVEGQRDVAALRALGCAGDIVPLNQGRPLFPFCEDLGKTCASAILITDWDRKGEQLLDQLSAGLSANGVRVDTTFRDRIRRALSLPIKDVESLAEYVRKGLEKFHKTTIEERRARPHNRGRLSSA